MGTYIERNNGTTRGMRNCETEERLREQTGTGKSYLLAGNALNTPLGRTLRIGSLKWKWTSSAVLEGIHIALAAVAPFMKRQMGGSRGTKGESEQMEKTHTE